MQLIFQAPCIQLTKLENIWFQLSSVSCNLKCKHCYLGCQPNNKKKYFLNIDKIKETLQQINHKELKTIYLTGGEPLLHPEIMNILRLCLRVAPVTILTNGTLLSEKKIKIIREIEEASAHEISFRISLDHYTEGRNDEFRGKGVFKKAVNSIINLTNYGYSPVISCVNIKNEEESSLKQGFVELFRKSGIVISENIKFIPLLMYGDSLKFQSQYQDNFIVEPKDLKKVDPGKLDCSNSRVVTIDGIYSCPALVSDPRGKVGVNMETVAPKVYLETQNCYNCINNSNKLFCNDLT